MPEGSLVFAAHTWGQQWERRWPGLLHLVEHVACHALERSLREAGYAEPELNGVTAHNHFVFIAHDYGRAICDTLAETDLAAYLGDDLDQVLKLERERTMDEIRLRTSTPSYGLRRDALAKAIPRPWKADPLGTLEGVDSAPAELVRQALSILSAETTTVPFDAEARQVVDAEAPTPLPQQRAGRVSCIAWVSSGRSPQDRVAEHALIERVRHGAQELVTTPYSGPAAGLYKVPGRNVVAVELAVDGVRGTGGAKAFVAALREWARDGDLTEAATAATAQVNRRNQCSAIRAMALGQQRYGYLTDATSRNNQPQPVGEADLRASLNRILQQPPSVTVGVR